MKTNIYNQITDKIISILETGIRPWHQPWNAEHALGKITRPLRFNGEPYSGINILSLWGAAMERNYTAPVWMTFNQAKKLGGYVRKGEQGSVVAYASTFKKTEHDKNTCEDTERNIPFMKRYAVFNVEQIESLPKSYYAAATEPVLKKEERLAALETFFERTGATINFGGNRAYYSLSLDYVQMPCFEFFESRESYYATLGHEVTHWTRHPSRLNRSFGRKRFGDEGYAMEELVAELGSAFLAADLDLTPDVREDHSSYIGHWLKILKNDNRAIFTAASHAQKAVEFLHNQQS